VYNQQCALDPLYDYGCDGWSDAYLEEYVEEEEPQVWEEVEEVEEIFVVEEPQVFEIIDIAPLENFTPATIEEAIVEIETVFEELAEEELIEELEAELEEFLEPEVEEELDEQESEEETVQEEQTTEEPQQEEVVVEVVEEPKLVEVKKKASKKQKMREIISNKLKNLAVEMGEAVSLEEQQKLQALILTLLNFNAGFNSYNIQLIDGIFYEDKGIYLDKDIPDNKRGLRNGLANEILHKKLIDLQWQR
jgi:ribonucleotide reductase alpha subunit